MKYVTFCVIFAVVGLSPGSSNAYPGGCIYANGRSDSIAMPVILDSPELEREYSPGDWSTRFATADEALQNHIQIVTAVSEEVTNNILNKLDIEYGPTLNQKLDIFGTDLPNDAPILVFVHGGYWQLLSREISRYPSGPLHRAGIKTVVVGYDLCPNATLPEIVQQMKNAARFVFEYADEMGSRGVYFSGHSSGAHLVAKMISDADFLDNTPRSNRLQGAFLISGAYDLRELVYTSVNDAVQLPAESAVALSPQFDCYTHLQNRSIRLYIFAGQNDSPTFKKQSREFYKLLLNSCLTANIEIKADLDHFSMVESLTADDNYLKNLLVHDIKHL